MKNTSLIYCLISISVFALTLAIFLGIDRTKPRVAEWHVRPFPRPTPLMDVNPPQPEINFPRQDRILTHPIPDIRTVDVGLTKGSILVLKEDVTIPANMCCEWKLSDDKTVACGYYTNPVGIDRMLIAGTKLSVVQIKKEKSVLPGNILSIEGQDIVIVTRTAGGTTIEIVVTAGYNLTIVKNGNLIQYVGKSRVPTMDELRNHFDVILVEPEVIRHG